MAQCKRCGKSGWFLKAKDNLCDNCNRTLAPIFLNDFRIFDDSLKILLSSTNSRTIMSRLEQCIECIRNISHESEFIEDRFIRDFNHIIDYYYAKLMQTYRIIREYGDNAVLFGLEMHDLIVLIFDDVIDPNTGEVKSRLDYEEILPYALRSKKQYEESIVAFDKYLNSIGYNEFLKTKYYFAQMAQVECLYRFRNDDRYKSKLESALFENAEIYVELGWRGAYSPSYHYLVQFLINNERYKEALEWCDKAIEEGYRHHSQGGYQGIKERILKKMAKVK